MRESFVAIDTDIRGIHTRLDAIEARLDVIDSHIGASLGADKRAWRWCAPMVGNYWKPIDRGSRYLRFLKRQLSYHKAREEHCPDDRNRGHLPGGRSALS